MKAVTFKCPKCGYVRRRRINIMELIAASVAIAAVRKATRELIKKNKEKKSKVGEMV